MSKIVNLGLYIEEYEPTPRDRKSFYGKARVLRFTDGWILKSYNTDVLAYKASTGVYIRLWGDYSATTGRHIASVAPFNKAGFCALPMGRLLGYYGENGADIILEGGSC